MLDSFQIRLLLALLSFTCTRSAADYSVFDESGASVGSLPSHQTIVKRDTVTQSSDGKSATIIQQDDHQYYTSHIIKNSTAWLEINPALTDLKKSSIHQGLSSKFRYAYVIQLPFVFPFYGIPLTSVTPTTGGFIFVGELIHTQLTDTQYIAPLMAEFNPSISNESSVIYYMTDSVVVVQWEKVYLHSMTSATGNPNDSKPFTFQVQLYKSGDIVFAYREVPYHPEYINDSAHFVKVGIAEAYYEIEKQEGGFTITIVKQYHKIDVDFDHVSPGTEVRLLSENTCVTAKSCKACTTLETNFNCVWCVGAQECGDGQSRYRNVWLSSKCNAKNITTHQQCPNEQASALPQKHPDKGAYEMVLCQESQTAVVCAGEDTVFIEEATFSRKNYHGSFCDGRGIIQSMTKMDDKCAYDNSLVTEVIAGHCNNQKACFIKATMEFFGSDPCPGYDKTLNIYYKCNSTGGSGSKVLIGFIVLIIIILIITCVGWFIYAYRNPTSRSGLWLIKYGRFWKSGVYKTDETESGI